MTTEEIFLAGILYLKRFYLKTSEISEFTLNKGLHSKVLEIAIPRSAASVRTSKQLFLTLKEPHHHHKDNS